MVGEVSRCLTMKTAVHHDTHLDDSAISKHLVVTHLGVMMYRCRVLFMIVLITVGLLIVVSFIVLLCITVSPIIIA